MADVRYTTGTPAASDFGGISTPTPSTPLIVNASGQLYALLGMTVTQLNAATSGDTTIIANKVFDQHPTQNWALLGNASDVIQSKVFRSGISTGMWG